ncbi:SH3 domain-containing protein [Streptomyces sp. NPDC005576]|uniref:SH3 domain-containing protein n=1 Tax=unclassified Streptomyces TaxID=2593676 RepID=UPI0033D20F01
MAVEENTAEATAPSKAAGAAGTVDPLRAPAAAEAATTSAAEPAGLAATLTYEAPRYPIAPGYRVYVRTGPGTNYAPIRLLPYGTMVAVYCQKEGERVSGPYGSSNLWDCISAGEYVSDAYVHTGSDGWIAGRCA